MLKKLAGRWLCSPCQLEQRTYQRLGDDQRRLVGPVTSMNRAFSSEWPLIFWKWASITDFDFMISLSKERTGDDTEAVRGDKSKDGNLDLGIRDAFWDKERNKINIKRITSWNRSSSVLWGAQCEWSAWRCTELLISLTWFYLLKYPTNDSCVGTREHPSLSHSAASVCPAPFKITFTSIQLY